MDGIDRHALWQMAGRSMAAALAGAPGLITRFTPGAWQVTSSIDSWTTRWVVCHDTDTASLALLHEALDEALTDRLTTSVVVSEPARDRVVPLFAGRPMQHESRPPMMWRDSRPLPPDPRPWPGRLARASNRDDLLAALDLAARAFDVDPAGERLAMTHALDDPAMRLYTATSDALDSMCLMSTMNGLAYVYLMATDPDRQGRGAGRALLAHAMDDAIAGGVHGFFLMASNEGIPLYTALGYQTYELPEFWTLRPPGSASG